MARKKKKAETDDIDDLAKDIEEDLAKEFNFDEGDEGETKTDKPVDYMGKTVSFQSDEGEEITGVVIKQTGDSLKIEDETSFWTADIEDVKLVEEETKTDSDDDEDVSLEDKAANDDDSDEGLGLADDPPEKAKKPTKAEIAAKKKADAAAKKKADAEKKKVDAAAKKKADAEKKTEKKGKKKKAETSEDEDEGLRGVRFRKMLPTKMVKGSKHKPREVDKDAPKYKSMKVDIKRRGQQDAIKVQSFTPKECYLIGGAHRLAVFEELDAEFPGKGWDVIECQADDLVQDEDDRLMAGILDNETRIAMHWLDLSKSCARLVKGGKWTQVKIARALGITPSEVSRMMTALKLPKETLKVARAADGAVSAGVFYEMASAPKTVVKELTSAIDKGKHITMTDVRAMKKADAADKAGDGDGGGDETTTGGATTPPARAYTYRDLSKTDVGDYLTIRVHGEHIELKAHIDWDKKTFRNFDPAKEIAALFDAVYIEESTSLDSVKALRKALQNARAELIAGQEKD